MKVKMKRDLYSAENGQVKAGDTVEVSQVRAKELIKNGRAEPVKATKQRSRSKAKQPATNKKASAAANKKAAAAPNKSAASPADYKKPGLIKRLTGNAGK